MIFQNNLSIREATDKDSSFIIDLIFDIWMNEYHFEVKKEDFPDLIDIEKYYTKSNGLFLVAVIDKKIMGTIACSQLDHNQYVLKRMFINKDYRRLGIAQQLLDKLLDNIVAITGDRNISIFLSTKESDAAAAKHFYLKNGFTVTDKSRLPDNFPFFYKDDLFMLKNKEK